MNLRRRVWRGACGVAVLSMLGACKIPIVGYSTSVGSEFDHGELAAHLSTMAHYVDGGVHESKNFSHASFRRGRAYATVSSETFRSPEASDQLGTISVWSDLSSQGLDLHLTWLCMQLQRDLIGQLRRDLPCFFDANWRLDDSLPDTPEYRELLAAAALAPGARDPGALPTLPTPTSSTNSGSGR